MSIANHYYYFFLANWVVMLFKGECVLYGVDFVLEALMFAWLPAIRNTDSSIVPSSYSTTTTTDNRQLKGVPCCESTLGDKFVKICV